MANNRELSQFGSFVEIDNSTVGITTNLNVTGIVSATTLRGNLQNTLTLSTSGTGLSGSTTFNNSGAATFTVTSNATSANTASTIVARDGSGNFIAGIITATTFSGALSGTATSTTNIPNLSGDVSSSNTVTTLATVNSNVGTYGGTGAIPVVTVNNKGLVTGVSTVSPNNGTLTLAVSGIGLSGSATFTANQSGSSTFTVTSNATSANTASTIVARDGSGNFIAGIITATTFSGNLALSNVTGLGANVATFLATPSSSNLASAVTDETGTGALVFANTPTLVTPVLGTPTSGTLTNCTGLPVSTGISGLAANVATFLATPSSANLAAAVTDETGTGALVFATSPTLVSPTLGTANATGINISGVTTSNSYNVGSAAGISTTVTTVATTAATAVESISTSIYRSARIQVQITQGTNYQVSDVLVIHNGTTANIVEYGSIATNDYLCSFSADVSGGNARLLVGMTTSTSATVKALTQKITV